MSNQIAEVKRLVSRLGFVSIGHRHYVRITAKQMHLLIVRKRLQANELEIEAGMLMIGIPGYYEYLHDRPFSPLISVAACPFYTTFTQHSFGVSLPRIQLPKNMSWTATEADAIAVCEYQLNKLAGTMRDYAQCIASLPPTYYEAMVKSPHLKSASDANEASLNCGGGSAHCSEIDMWMSNSWLAVGFMLMRIAHASGHGDIESEYYNICRWEIEAHFKSDFRNKSLAALDRGRNPSTKPYWSLESIIRTKFRQ